MVKRISFLFLCTILLLTGERLFSQTYTYYKSFGVCDASFATEISVAKVNMLVNKKIIGINNAVRADASDIKGKNLTSYYAVNMDGDKISEINYYHNYGNVYTCFFQYNTFGQLVGKVLYYPPDDIAYIKSYYYSPDGKLDRTYYLDKGFFYKKFIYDNAGRLKQIKWYALSNGGGNSFIEKFIIDFHVNGAVERMIKDKLQPEEEQIAKFIRLQMKRMLKVKEQLERLGKHEICSYMSVKMTPRDFADIMVEVNKYKDILDKTIKEYGYSKKEFEDFKKMLYANVEMKKSIDKAVKTKNTSKLNAKRSSYFDEMLVGKDKKRGNDIEESYDDDDDDVKSSSKMTPEDYAEIVVDSLENQEMLEDLLKAKSYTMEDFKAFQEELKTNVKLNSITNELITDYFSQKTFPSEESKVESKK